MWETHPGQTVLRLPEQAPQIVAGDALAPADERLLWQHYRAQVRVEPVRLPSDGSIEDSTEDPSEDASSSDRPVPGWRLTNLGWVGYLPLTDSRGLWLEPKIPVANLCALFEWVYRLDALHFQPGETRLGTLEGFYASLAGALAAGVLRRAGQGLYRSYRQHQDRLPFVRGRLLPDPPGTPPVPSALCQFHEAGPDNLENRLLLAALHRILHSQLCREEALPPVRRAYRLLAGRVALVDCTGADCQRVAYHRLNRDYRPLHGLARFFLEGSGPSHFLGQRPVLPFLVEMARLFEQCVAAWLAGHLPPGWTLRAQQQLPLDEQAQRAVVPDALLYDETGRLRWVLDTKYKTDTGAGRSGPSSAGPSSAGPSNAGPSNEDIYQIVTYAHALGCGQGALIYPQALAQPLDVTVNGIRVRSVSFPLGEPVSRAGETLLAGLAL